MGTQKKNTQRIIAWLPKLKDKHFNKIQDAIDKEAQKRYINPKTEPEQVGSNGHNESTEQL